MYIALLEEGPLSQWLRDRAGGHSYAVFHYMGTDKYRLDIFDKQRTRVYTLDKTFENEYTARDWGYARFIDYLVRQLFLQGDEEEL